MDDDAELREIRARRMAQLQASGGGGGGGGARGGPPMGGPGGPGGGGPGGEGQSREEQEAKQRAEDEQMRTIMASVLEPEARERLSRISMTRPAVAKQIQQILLRMAQQGQLRGRVSDDQLVGLLEQAQAANSGSTGGGGKISFQRKSRDSDDDDDFDL